MPYLSRAERFVARFENTAHRGDCKYGHFDCSTHADGPCLDEALGLIEAHEDAEEPCPDCSRPWPDDCVCGRAAVDFEDRAYGRPD